MKLSLLSGKQWVLLQDKKWKMKKSWLTRYQHILEQIHTRNSGTCSLCQTGN